NDAWNFTGSSNYNDAMGTVNNAIGKATATVTVEVSNKYCGQQDPTFTGSLSGFITSDNVTASYSRTSGEAVGGSYVISATLSPSGVLSNYNITYNTALFTIKGISIDASASNTSVQQGNPVNLTATVTPNQPGVAV